MITRCLTIKLSRPMENLNSYLVGKKPSPFGHSITGQTLLLTLDFVGQEIKEVTNLTLVGIGGTSLETFNITQGKGFYQDFYYVKFIPSTDRFRIKLTGFDTTSTVVTVQTPFFQGDL